MYVVVKRLSTATRTMPKITYDWRQLSRYQSPKKGNCSCASGIVDVFPYKRKVAAANNQRDHLSDVNLNLDPTLFFPHRLLSLSFHYCSSSSQHSLTQFGDLLELMRYSLLHNLNGEKELGRHSGLI